MTRSSDYDITNVIGKMPFRIALAGGWIDQPFVSQHDPAPPGSMVVACIEPQFLWMNRAGICSSTRQIAQQLWGDTLPRRPVEDLVRELYEAENAGSAEPSGSQDMIGLIHPGVSRLDYDYGHHEGYFPRHIESTTDPRVVSWLEQSIWILPVAPRPHGYNPLETKNLDPQWIRRLGRSGADCFDAIVARDIAALGASMNECMRCWEAILPGTVRHPTLQLDLLSLLEHYQRCYAGAMYSGCGGGYLFVASDRPVPGAFQITVRTERP